MSIRVEFYGIPRIRIGAGSVELETATEGIRLVDLFQQLAARFPKFAEDCLDGQRLRSGYSANIDGERFVDDPETLVCKGQALLIMSADAGG